MERLSDWPERLASFVASVQNVPFAWGVHDCATFARGAVHAVTGVWVEEGAFGQYTSAAQALRLMRAAPLKQRVTQVLGEPHSMPFAPRGAVPYARRGDVVLYPHSEHGTALGVCTGAVFIAPGDDGLYSCSMNRALCSWWVG